MGGGRVQMARNLWLGGSAKVTMIKKRCRLFWMICYSYYMFIVVMNVHDKGGWNKKYGECDRSIQTMFLNNP